MHAHITRAISRRVWIDRFPVITRSNPHDTQNTKFIGRESRKRIVSVRSQRCKMTNLQEKKTQHHCYYTSERVYKTPKKYTRWKKVTGHFVY